MNITKKEICNRIFKKLSELNRKPDDIKSVVDAFLNEILLILSENNNIEIRGFGAFKTKDVTERLGRNPRTGDTVPIKNHKVPKFKFSREALKIFNSFRNKNGCNN